MLDIIAPRPAGPVQHAMIEISVGGCAANAARAAVAGGHRAAVVGAVGDDAIAELVRTDLTAAGIEVRLATVPGQRTGRVVYVGDAVVAERGANGGFTSDVTGIDSRVVLISGYQLFREDSGPATAHALDADGLVGLDLGSGRVVASYGPRRARLLSQRADVIFGNRDAINALGALDGPLVVTTLGREGARAGSLTVRPAEMVEGAGPGAGDAFAAAFLLARAFGAAIDEALADGCTAAVNALRGIRAE